MRVAVTGANGFVGRALVRELCEREFNVRMIVRSAKNLHCCKGNTDIYLVNEINGHTDWTEALKGIEVVIHLASLVHVMHDNSTALHDEYKRVNTEGTKRLVEMSVASGVKRFIFLSTVKVNGERTNDSMWVRASNLEQPVSNNIIAFSEEDNPTPSGSYAVSKWEAEQAIQSTSEKTGLETVVLRPPLIYGPGVKANVLSIFKIVERGIPLPLSSIKNRRSLIYLGNVVDVIIRCINHPMAAGKTYLVSDGEDVSTPELIRRVAFALDRRARLFPFPPSLIRVAGSITGKSYVVDRLISSLAVNIAKVTRELQWMPPYSMEQGLKDTAVWFKSKVIGS